MTVQKWALNPIVQWYPPESSAYDPATLTDDGVPSVMMYKSERGEPVTGYDCIRRATSSDSGEAWDRALPNTTPEIGNLQDGSWQDRDVREPRTFFDKNTQTLHLYYNASDPTLSITRSGYIKSADLGVTWTSRSSSPLFDQSDFPAWPGGTPTYMDISWVFIVGTTYWCYGSTLNRMWYSKGTSMTDLKSITAPTVMISPPSGSNEIWEGRPFVDPNGGYGMVTTCQRTADSSWRLDLWTSPDLVTWTIKTQDVVPSGIADSWDSGNCYSWKYVTNADGKWLTPLNIDGYMWFYYSGGCAEQGNKANIGLARTPFASPFGL